MTTRFQGVVHGRTIEVDSDLGIADGESVEVEVRRKQNAPRNPGDGIRESAGGWKDYPELDAVMERIERDRKQERTPQDLP